MSDTSNGDQLLSPAPVIRLEAVGLSYDKTRALDGVTLDIPSARMVGLIGPDGVGKSSLLASRRRPRHPGWTDSGARRRYGG